MLLVALYLGPACVPPGHPERIPTLLYVHAHLALLSVSISLVAAHFPQDPGVVTADGEGGKGSVIEGVHQAFRHQSFMLLAVSGGLVNGVFNGWSGVMSGILSPQGFSSTDAGWISFAATVGACGGGLLLGSLLDSHLQRIFKTVLLVLLCCCGVCFTWFTLGLPSALYDVPPLIWVLDYSGRCHAGKLDARDDSSSALRVGNGADIPFAGVCVLWVTHFVHERWYDGVFVCASGCECLHECDHDWHCAFGGADGSCSYRAVPTIHKRQQTCLIKKHIMVSTHVTVPTGHVLVKLQTSACVRGSLHHQATCA